MKICIIGTGYVGLTAVCFADFGHRVVLVGRALDKIDLINRGVSPIYEPGLDEILKRNVDNGRIFATNDYSEVKDSDAVFLCVGTPSNPDGSIDLSQIKEASRSIGEQLKNTDKYIVVVVKSTVVPKTTKYVVLPILEESSGKKAGRDFGVCMNPEFLREGSGVNDFLYPDKIVIGSLDEKSRTALDELYRPFDSKVHRIYTELSTAEMIKYAQNSALAARISFINEIANICEKFEVDVRDVAHAVGLDSRIGPKFLDSGIGFGGSCFPKDVKALFSAARSSGIESPMLKTTLEINDKQPYRLVELAKNVLGNLDGKTIGVMGLAFKDNTDDMREAPSIKIINSLLESGAKVKAYDPKATENARVVFNNSIEYCSSAEECLQNIDLCMFVTEWDEFRKIDMSKIKSPVVDGRRIIDPKSAEERGLIYKGIGWKNNG